MEAIYPGLTSVFEWVWRSSWQATVLVGLVLGVQWLLGHRLSARWRYALWFLVLARLMVPFTPTSAFSVFNFTRFGPVARLELVKPMNAGERRVFPEQLESHRLAREESTSADDVTVPTRQLNLDGASDRSASLAKPVTQPATRLPRVWSWAQVMMALWLAGVGIVAVRFVWETIRFAWRMRQYAPSSDRSMTAMMQECRQAMGVRPPVAIMETDTVCVPAMFGFLRPRLLLPACFGDRFSPEELRLIFLHELAHFKRGDLVTNWLLMILNTLHWFNPVIWFAFARLRSDRELACDELVLSLSRGDEGKRYGQVIIKLMEEFAEPARLTGLVGVLEDKNQMERRIRMIAKFKKTNRWSVFALALLLALGLLTLTDAQNQSEKPKTSTSTQLATRALGKQMPGKSSPEILARHYRYAADMMLAAQAVQEEVSGKAQDLLAKYADEKDDIRGWEWRYLWSQSQSDELRTLFKTEKPLYGLCMGKSGVLAFDDGSESILLWDWATERLRHTLPIKSPARPLGFSPDGIVVVVASAGQAGADPSFQGIQLWDARAGLKLGKLETRSYPRFPLWTQPLAFTPDGKTLVVGTLSADIDVFDVATQTLVGKIVGAHDITSDGRGALGAVAISPDGKLLASATQPGEIKLWNLATRLLQRTLLGKPEGAGALTVGTSLAFSPDGKNLAAYAAGVLSVWNTENWHKDKELASPGGSCLFLRYSPDGTILAGANNPVRLWRTGSWELIGLLRGHAREITGCEFSPDGKRLVTASGDGTVKVWPVQPESGRTNPRVLKAGADDLRWSPSGEHFLTKHADGQLKVWKTESLEVIRTLDFAAEIKNLPMTGGMLGMALAPKGEFLATGYNDGTIKLWDLRTGRTVKSLEGSKKFNPPLRLAFTRDGKRLASLGGAGIQLFDVAESRLLAEVETSFWGYAWNFNFSPDEKLLCISSIPGDLKVHLFELPSLRQAAVLQGHKEQTLSSVFSPNGQWLATGSIGGEVIIWDVASHTRLTRFKTYGGNAKWLSFSPDGERLSVASPRGALFIYDTLTWQEVARLTHPSDKGSGSRFTPDGNAIIHGPIKGDLIAYRAPTLTEIAKAEKPTPRAK